MGGAAEKLLKDQQKQMNDEEQRWCGFVTDTSTIRNASFGRVKSWCCKDGPIRGPDEDCGDPSNLKGFAAKHMIQFALDDSAWITSFKKTWNKATALGM